MKHTIPTLLETKDRILFGLTAKQVLLCCAGLSCTYLGWQLLPADISPAGFVLWLLLSCVPSLVALLLAFVQMGGQSIDEWCMVWFFYLQTPKCYTWELLSEDQTERSSKELHLLVEED